MTNQERIEAAYTANYQAAMSAMRAITESIHGMIAPESEFLKWGHVADMSRIASDLEAITEYLSNP
jgi:hypothetical protein